MSQLSKKIIKSGLVLFIPVGLIFAILELATCGWIDDISSALSVAYSPDGKTFAITSSTEIYVFENK